MLFCLTGKEANIRCGVICSRPYSWFYWHPIYVSEIQIHTSDNLIIKHIFEHISIAHN